MSYNRRSFLQTSALLGAASLGIFPSKKAQARDLLSNEFFSRGPIEALSKFEGTSIFGGDHEMAGHEIFWDKVGFLKKFGPIPAPSRSFDVIVLGGGIAGLTSSYLHRHENTLLIDGHPQMGGNSKAETFQNLSMSTGAAYINIPEDGDPLDAFLSELELKHKFRVEPADDFTVGLNGKITPGFWNQSAEFERVREKFAELYENEYPELPVYPEANSSNREKLNAFDRLTFSEWARKNLGEVHPQITEFFHQYCWSSFGGSPDELSAAQVAGFISSDLHGIQALPGGNAVIAEAIYRKLKGSRVNLLNNAFAVNVKNTGSGVEVTYFEDNKRLVTVRARKVIMSMPKQVAKYLIEDIAKDQYEAMRDMRYRAYLMVNVLLDKKITSPGYDLFALRGKVPQSPKKEIEERGFCDIIFADWANFDRAAQSALTLYVPMSFDGANQLLFSPFTYEKHQARVMKNLTPWLAELGLTEKNVTGMRMARYGHALPLAKVGQISSGVFERAHRTIDDAIFFAHSDNWGNPCLETAFYSARAAFA